MKRWIVTLALVWLMAAPPVPAQQTPPPQPKFTLVEFCIVVPLLVLATAAVICVVVREHNKPWPTNSPPATNFIPPTTGTNQFGTWTNIVASNDLHLEGPIACADVSSMGWIDSYAGRGTVYFTNFFQLTITTGTRPDQLAPIYVIKAWMSSHGRLFSYEDLHGNFLGSCYADWSSIPQAPAVGRSFETQRFVSFVSP
jgi:hypothetical protein